MKMISVGVDFPQAFWCHLIASVSLIQTCKARLSPVPVLYINCSFAEVYRVRCSGRFLFQIIIFLLFIDFIIIVFSTVGNGNIHRNMRPFVISPRVKVYEL